MVRTEMLDSFLSCSQDLQDDCTIMFKMFNFPNYTSCPFLIAHEYNVNKAFCITCTRLFLPSTEVDNIKSQWEMNICETSQT